MHTGPFILRNGLIAERAQRAIDRCLASGKLWVVTIEPHKNSRSLEQNAYFHGPVLGTFADFTGYAPKAMKETLKHECAPRVTYKDMEGNELVRPMGTSEMNVAQFSVFLERVNALAADMGLVIPPPEWRG